MASAAAEDLPEPFVDQAITLAGALGGLASLRRLGYENTKPSTPEIDQWLSHYRP